jgi:predicted transglutaminase-like cysteine proteinase
MPRLSRWYWSVLVGVWWLGLLMPGTGTGWAWDAGRIRAEAQRYAEPVPKLADEVLELVLGLSQRNELEKVRQVNSFYNQKIVFQDDRVVWGVQDYWASPLELFSKGAGDCEDFALAKYFTLMMAGVPPTRLRLVYVRAQMPSAPNGVQAHMVLAYYADAVSPPWILDNLVQSLERASRRPDLVPVFSFNSEGLYVGSGSERVGDAVARLSRWSDVLSKARREGFL